MEKEETSKLNLVDLEQDCDLNICIKWPVRRRLEVERPLTRRHEARFECERARLACRHRRCLARRRRGGAPEWRIDPTKAVARRAYSFRARRHIPAPSLPPSPPTTPPSPPGIPPTLC